MSSSGQPGRFDREVEAGALAYEESRFQDAITHFQAALRMAAPSREAEAETRCRLSEALEKSGRRTDLLSAVAKYEQAAEFALLAERTQVRVLLRFGWGRVFINDIPRAIATFNRALQVARYLDEPALVGDCHFGLGRTYSVFTELRLARDHYTTALEHFRPSGNWRSLAEAYLSIGYILAREGDYASAVYSVQQGLAIIGSREVPDMIGRAHWYLSVSYDSLGKASESIAASEICIRSYQRAGNTLLAALNQNNFAMQLIRACQWERAEAVIRSAIQQVENRESPIAYGGALDSLGLLYLLRGNLNEAERHLFAALETLTSIRENVWAAVPTRATIGRLWLTWGRPDLAIPQLERAVEDAGRRGEQQDLPEAQLWMAEALLATGEITGARQLVETVQAQQRRAPNMLAWGLMMRVAAKVAASDGRREEAIHLLEQSSSVYQFRQNRYEHAVNLMLLAGWCDAQGRRAESIRHAETALGEFERLGAALDVERARDYLAALARMGAPSASATDSLLQSPALIVNDHTATRLLLASALPDLLLYEMAEIARTAAAARGAIVAEIKPNAGLYLVAAVRLAEAEAARHLQVLADLEPSDYARHGAYAFNDNHGGVFVLRLIDQMNPEPPEVTALLMLVEQCLEAQKLRSVSRKAARFNATRLLADVKMPGFVCASRAMLRVLEMIEKVRSSDVTVLVTGESGTGKELIARMVHGSSVRQMNRYLPINCAASPRDLIDSQLFGFRKGAFTGAIADHLGIIRAAEGGTLFLDEIGCLPLDLQPKLLRFLQEGEILPVGETRPLRVNVRSVAATNSDLETEVAEGRFREDLFYRLNVYRLELPPLRERKEEVPLLAAYYLDEFMRATGKREIGLSQEAIDLMVVYDWPGNVRQLCTEVRRIVVNHQSGTVVMPEALSAEIIRSGAWQGNGHVLRLELAESRNGHSGLAGQLDGLTLDEALGRFEEMIIKRAIERAGGNMTAAARELGIARRTIYAKMERLNSEAEAT